MTDEEDKREEKSELSRFRDLARKLIRVPRHEIDAEQTKEDERRKDGHRD